MILIDEVPDMKLAEALEALKESDSNARCIYFSLAGSAVAPGLREVVVAAAVRSLASAEPQLYFCEDGDICLIAPYIHGKDGREFILEIAGFLGRPATSDWVDFLQLPLQLNTLLVVVEKKLVKRRIAEQEKRRAQEQHQAARKRESILAQKVNISASEIRERRERRGQPELMMIEDDAFSRRLVENVLQKKYAMTSLGEADRALETYARLAPDVLFLDINLPDVTGLELLERVLALDPEAYVVMLSGNADRENITQAMSKGAKGFIGKPFTREKLFQYLDRCPTIRTTTFAE